MNRTIQPDDRISHYRVVGPLGSGGMGEVYLAHDQKLERSVALKVLPLDLVRDEERVRRFVREAKSASSLNHPNIVAIYEIGHEPVHAAGDDQPVSEAIHFISMELVTGETLGDKIRSRKTDLKTLIGYLTQAAEGIAKAHSAGIVHRDLKPSNIMISQDGYAKVLDFGLAKLVEHQVVSGEDSATVTVPLQDTRSGTMLGTVGYMSPEQIRGSKVDHRSDIFSFGCVLYECVTGQRAFRANTDVETLHQILHQEPTPVEELNPDAPRALQRLIKRCLVRNPDRRLQSMKDLAIELQEIVDEYETLTSSSGSSATVDSGSHLMVGGRRIPPLVLGVAAVVAVVIVWKLWPPPDPKPIDERSSVHSGVTGILSEVSTCTVSPDGKYLAYAAGDQGRDGLWIRQLATGTDVEVSATIDGEIDNISFSPDGSYIYFASRDAGGFFEIYQVPSLGGSPQRILLDVDSRLSISPDGRRACFRRGKPGEALVTDLVIVDLDSRKESILSTANGFTFASPAWSPSGERIAAIMKGSLDTLVVIDAATGAAMPLGGTWFYANSCVWLPEDRGVILAASTRNEGSSIWRVSYPSDVVQRITADQQSYEDVSLSADGSVLVAQRQSFPANLWSAPVAGNPSPRRLTNSSAGTGGLNTGFRVVDDGSIVTSWGGQMRLLDGQGGQLRLVTGALDMSCYEPRRVSGGILFHGITKSEDDYHIWHVDLAGGAPTQLTPGPGNQFVEGTGSNSFLYNVSGVETHVYLLPVQGGEPREVPGHWPCRISPDGKWLFTCTRTNQTTRVVVRSIDTLEPQLEFDVSYPNWLSWTPGSDAVAHIVSSGESQQIVLQPLNGSEPRSLLDITPPRLNLNHRVEHYNWSPDGKTLCLRFWDEDAVNLWVVPVDGGELRPITDLPTGRIYSWDWALDSQRVYFTWGIHQQDAVLIHDFE